MSSNGKRGSAVGGGNPRAHERKGKLILSNQMKLFVLYYLQKPNGKWAAAQAGYSPPNAHTIACNLLKHPLVAEAIRQGQERIAAKAEVDAAWVLKELKNEYLELKQINHADIAEIYDKDGSLLPIDKWPEYWRYKQVVSKIKVQETTMLDRETKKVVRTGYIREVHGAELKAQELRTLELLGKHVNVSAFEERVRSTGSVTLKVEYDEGKTKVVDKSAPAKPNGHDQEPAG